MSRYIAVSIVAVAAVFFSGCGFERTNPNKQYYIFDGAEALTVAADKESGSKSHKGMTVQVAPFLINSITNHNGLIYRVSDTMFDIDYYNELITVPSAIVDANFKEALIDAGYAVVSERSDYSVFGTLNALYGDFRDKKHPYAVIDINVVVRSNQLQKMIGTKHYKYEEDIKVRSPEGVVEAYGVCMGKVLSEFLSDFEEIIKDNSSQ